MEFTLEQAFFSLIIAFVVHVVVCPLLIPFLIRFKFGQTIRAEGPKSHIKKAGTPTMGGVAIIISFVAGTAFFLKNNNEALMLVFVSLGFGSIGFLDDYIKIKKKRSLGLRAYQKIIAQLVIAGIFIWYMTKSGNLYFQSGVTGVLVPFGSTIDLGYLYIPFALFFIIAVVNGANLTDGLDGLASGVTVIMTSFFALMAWIAGSGALPASAALVGSLLGFLLFNSYPAKLIMGDTGSMALGGFIAGTTLLLRMPLFILIIGIVYVMESLSVVLQVGYFKITGGKKIFKMTPIHHSFEESGWPETRITALFYIITLIACLTGFYAAGRFL